MNNTLHFSAMAFGAAAFVMLPGSLSHAENAGGFATKTNFSAHKPSARKPKAKRKRRQASRSNTRSFRFSDFFRPALARGKVVATVDLSDQRMTVYVGGRKYDSYPVSTGRRGYRTPTGSWRPTRLHEMWYSRKYDNSPMPHSVFFMGGYAVHGTNSVSRLGRPASHGCVRLHPSDAKAFYELVKVNGMRNARIRVKP